MAIRDYFPTCWHRRNRGHHKVDHNRIGYKHLVSVLAVITATPAFAENTSVSANPQAAITGSVANQAVQINQGSLSTQSFGGNIHCNSAVISFTPYILSTENWASTYSKSRNTGGQVSLSIPLDGGAVERCKALAKIQIEKTRLDYELIRVKECINIFERGFMIHPSSQFYPLCADVIPIAAAPKSEPEASPEL